MNVAIAYGIAARLIFGWKHLFVRGMGGLPPINLIRILWRCRDACVMRAHWGRSSGGRGPVALATQRGASASALLSEEVDGAAESTHPTPTPTLPEP